MITIGRKRGRAKDSAVSHEFVLANGVGGTLPTAAVFMPEASGPAIVGQRALGSSFGRLRAMVLARRLQADAATLLAQERRRVAADVHDLIMQDLAFALATARALAEEPDGSPPYAATIVAAGERALAGARGLVEALVREDRRPIVEALRDSVQQAARYTSLSFDGSGVAARARPDRGTVETLLHVGREAVTNAIKHADAKQIDVSLEYADEWRLRVRDDGHGFDLAGTDPGFGLESMRRHAEALGGSLRLTSTFAAGTTVEVSLP
jgi:signal transduction histidine kinase